MIALRAQLADAEEALRAIRNGEVDSVVVPGKRGNQVFTLEGAEHAYRVLIESMNEGAIMLTANKTILYANEGFARMVKFPLEQVIGSSFLRYISTEHRATLRPLLRDAQTPGSKIQVLLNASDGSQMGAQISVQLLDPEGTRHPTIGMVVTDMTEARRNEELLRALNHRVVQVQEAERERLALELHDHITQLLCGILFRSQALVDELATRDGPAWEEAKKLREMLGETAAEVERISRNLRPGALDQLGLSAVLRATSKEFTERTGIPIEVAGGSQAGRLRPEVELALYRILQEALKNVEQHARAQRVKVELTSLRRFVRLTIADDGLGFDAEHHVSRRKGKRVLGLIGMRERAAYLGGALTLKSARGAGTEISVRIPVGPARSP